MVVNDNACCLNDRVALRFFASRARPTVVAGILRPEGGENNVQVYDHVKRSADEAAGM